MKPKILIHTVRALTDNYCYVLHRDGCLEAVVTDPSETLAIETFLTQNKLTPSLILNTHHHHDHVGGNLDLKSHFDLSIYCSKTDFDLARVPGADRGLADSEVFNFEPKTSEEIEFKVVAIPGHTRGQIAYLVEENSALFVGDTLFSMGCGRLFEGTPAEMRNSLLKICALPGKTQIYFGHEYTETNAKFALQVDPSRRNEIQERLEKTRSNLTANGVAKAPTIEEELAVNPFLRSNDLESFTRLREMRNTFKA